MATFGSRLKTEKSSLPTNHLFLSFNLGGWKLLFDIRNKALSETEKHIYWLKTAIGRRPNNECGEAAVMKSSYERVEEHQKSSVPHWVQVEHWRLQLSQLDGGDADSPDVAQLVVAAVLLHRCHFWSHPEEKKKKQSRTQPGNIRPRF